MDLKHLAHSISSSVFEEEAPKPAVHPQAPAPPIVVNTNVGYQAPPSATGVVGDSVDPHDDSYQRLAAKTDWTKAPTFLAIQKYLGPMASMPVDDKTKFTIAVKQAQTNDAVDPAAINQNFETLKNVLQHEADTFAQMVSAKTASDVEAKKKQAADLTAQAQQLNEDAFAASQRLQTAQHKFDSALQTRLTEINQEQAKYASLLA